MASSQFTFRDVVEEGIRAYPDMTNYTLRKIRIVLTYGKLKRRLEAAAAEAASRPPVPEPEYLDYTEMFITSYCNLKCKYCSASIPYYYNKYHIDYEFLLRQLSAYLDLIDGVETFRILGGEPFLHPHLADILQPLVDSEKIHSLHIVTNGTVVPSEPRVRELLRSKKVWLDISNYGAVSCNVDELQRLHDAGEMQIIVDHVTTWFMPNHRYEDLGMSEQAAATRYHNCPDYCHVLRDGKFFSCGEAFHIANIPDSPMRAGVDYVDVLGGEGTREQRRREMLDVAFKRKPSMAACNRCGGGSFIYKDRVLVAGEQPAPGEEVVDFDLPADIPVVSTKMI